MRTCRKRRRQEKIQLKRGFTITETMCALTILVTGIFGIFTLLITSIQVDSESQHYATARAAAKQQLEAARVYGFGNESQVPPSTNLPAGGHETLASVPFNGSPDVDQVTVTLSWPEPGRGSNSVVVSTLIERGGISGS